MRIDRLRAVLLTAPYEPGSELAWVGGTIESWNAALVEVRTTDGVTGLGEVAQGIMAAAAVPGIVDALSPYVIGHDLEPAHTGDYLRDRTAFWARGGVCSGVIGAVETACLDAAGKTSSVPMHVLLGGRDVGSLEAYASGGLGATPEQILTWARAQEEAGFGTVKFRAMRDPETTVSLLEHVVPRLRAGTRFVLDAVQGCASRPWSVADAVRVGQKVAEFGGRWFEEPCRAEDVGGYAAVRRCVDVAVSGVESMASSREFQALLDIGGVDIVQPDAAMVGGPAEMSRVAAAAHARGVAAVPHTWGSAVTMMANLHTAASTGTISLFEYCRVPNPLRDVLLVEPLVVENGRIDVPKAPGLGVQLTADVERRFPFNGTVGHVIS